MALRITDECIVCNACEPACPNNAIYEPGVEWAIADGTGVKTPYILLDGTTTMPAARHSPISATYYYIVTDKCTECQGFHEVPQCADVCPVDCCIPDEQYRETEQELLGKKDRLYP